ncbi:MAG: hypothetical protein J1G06_08040 [Oscillospiraceae bacterium]|nr:hypothetical protein [Oscillospiraceae bacterium]
MNEQRFKTEYQRSENSVPVNTELKKKLVEMAREYERSESIKPEITISHNSQKKRIRRIITELSAIAACAALCAYTIPKISNQYFDRSIENELIISTEQTESPDSNPGKSDTEQVPSQADASGTADVPVAVKPAPQSDTAGNSAAPTRSNTTARANDNTAAAGSAAPHNNVTESYVPESDKSNQVRSIYTLPNDDSEYSKSELDTRIDTIAKNNSKLKNWDDTLAPYKYDDDIIIGYYKNFSQSVSEYTAAVDDFEKSYGNANDSGQIYEGIEKYDTEIDGILFESCRADYRKAKNYIEMNLADYPTDEQEEMKALEVSVEEDGTEVEE